MKKEVKKQQLEKQLKKVDKKQNTWTTVSDLNRLYKVDRILLKFAYDHYPDKATLESSSEYKNVEKFYRYVLDKLFEIEKDYLADDPAQSTNTYQVNKNSTSKFIRDENEHFHQIFKQFAEKVNEDQLGINGLKIYDFMKKLFDTQYTAVIIDGEPYFADSKKQSTASEIEQTLKMYHVVSKDMDEKTFVTAHTWINEDQLLDFLSYWLKEREDQQFYLLYCRTEEKLAKDVAYLKAEAKKSKQKTEGQNQKGGNPIHPTQLSMQAKEVEGQQGENHQPAEGDDDGEENIRTAVGKKKEQNVPDILKKYRKNKVDDEEPQQQKVPKPPPPTKRQQVEAKLGQIFQQSCKRRYVLSKATTFDQIQTEGKTMNLQKFINFCNFYKITQQVSRELLVELFKMYAANRLVIDQEKFKTIMKRFMDTDSRVVDLLMTKEPPQKKIRQKSHLSDYKFKLRPVNGKDPRALQIELQSIRMAKSRSRQEKLNLYYLKKNKLKSGQLPGKKQKIVLSSRIMPQRTSLLQLENIRDDKFDPEYFLGDDPDELLNAYESRMQKKTDQPFGLQSVLSRRIERGQKVVKKINEKNLKLYQ